ncbi:MAG: CHASE2 domain-containing protein [Firmicutes bacterium]|nr:CHASE2 domain-containing protein [Bacillota bacterium]
MKNGRDKLLIRFSYIFAALFITLFCSYTPVSVWMDDIFSKAKVALFNAVHFEDAKLYNSVTLVEIENKKLPDQDANFTPETLATILHNARTAGADSVFFLFPAGSGFNTEQLKTFAGVMRNSIPVYLSYTLNQPLYETTELVPEFPPHELTSASAGYGFTLPVFRQNDGLYRKKVVPGQNSKKVYSIESLVAARIRGIKTNELSASAAGISMNGQLVSTDRNGDILYLPSDMKKFDSVSFEDLLSGKKKEKLKNRMLLIGYKGKTGISPVQAAGSTAVALSTGQVVIPAAIWSNILFLTVLAVFVSVIISLFHGKWTLFAAGGTVFLALMLNTILFLGGFNFSVAPVLIMIPAYTAGLMFYRDYKARGLALSYVPKQAIRILQENHNKYGSRHLVKYVSVLFSDIKGYTTLSERYSPEIVMDLLDEYIHVMNQIVDKNKGVMMTYQGDALMAVFGLDGGEDENHALNAIKAADMMQEALKDMRRKWRMEYRELFAVGIGITTGNVAIGPLGSDSFRQFTVIGDTVNLSARLQTLGKELRAQILINEESYRMAKKYICASPINPTRLKGKFQECRIFEVNNAGNPGPRKSPGILTTDDQETAVMKKINYYREIKESLEV